MFSAFRVVAAIGILVVVGGGALVSGVPKDVSRGDPGDGIAAADPASPSPRSGSILPDGAALFTGRLLFNGTCSGNTIVVEDGVTKERGSVCDPTVEATDPRISGHTQNRGNSDAYNIDGVPGSGFYWGEMTITNEGGSWVGTWTGFSRAGSDWDDGELQFMVGQGGYAGLVAAWREQGGSGNWLDLEGIIVAGELPPSVIADLP